MELGSSSASSLKPFDGKHLLGFCWFRVCSISPILNLEQGGPFQHRRCTEIGFFFYLFGNFSGRSAARPGDLKRKCLCRGQCDIRSVCALSVGPSCWSLKGFIHGVGLSGEVSELMSTRASWACLGLDDSCSHRRGGNVQDEIWREQESVWKSCGWEAGRKAVVEWVGSEEMEQILSRAVQRCSRAQQQEKGRTLNVG